MPLLTSARCVIFVSNCYQFSSWGVPWPHFAVTVTESPIDDSRYPLTLKNRLSSFPKVCSLSRKSESNRPLSWFISLPIGVVYSGNGLVSTHKQLILQDNSG